MPHFIRRLETEQGPLNFYFNRIFTAVGLRYHISVLDKHRHSHSFNMQEGTDNWHLADKETCPAWIIKMEKKLESVIREHLAEL